METFLKVSIFHFVIFFISVFGLTWFYEIFQSELGREIFAGFHFFTIMFLYVLTGYILAKKNNKELYVCYLLITMISVAFWLFCLIKSPNTLNYKSNVGGVWLFYRFYIRGIEVPLVFINKYNVLIFQSVKRQMFTLLGLSFLPLVFQVIGTKIKRH